MFIRKWHPRAWAAIAAVALIVALSVIAGPAANAAYTTQVALGAARPFAVLAGAAVTGNATTVINGNVGYGTVMTFTGTVNGTTTGPASAWLPARDALTAAYADAFTRASTPIAAELGGTTRFAGAYNSLADAAFAITTPLTLDAQNDPNAVFIFKTGPTAGLDTTASVGNVVLINGAQACNVFWQVGGAVTLGASTTFRGNILAFAAITAGANTRIDGRAFSVTAAVTLDANTVGGCDTIAPTITAPANVVTTTGAGATLCSAVVAEALLTATASDNSGSVTVSRVPAGNTFAVGGTTVTYTASDIAGNTATATQLVTVTDNTVPTITAPANASYQFASDVPAANPNAATAADNCGAPTVTVAETNNGGAGTLANPLIITRTYTATDATANTASAIQTITVADTTAPTITAPSAVGTTTGPTATSCGAVVSDLALGTATASDNSGAPVTVTRTGVPAGNIFAVGVTTITYTATDAAGNTASATQLVTVTDNTVPTITAPANASYLFASDVPAANPSAATAADNCGAPAVTVVETNNGGAGTVANPLIITRTFTATDAAANAAQAVQTITVADTTPPAPTATPTPAPTATPTPAPTATPTPTPTPTAAPTAAPTATPTAAPTPTPTPAPTATPTAAPTPTPTAAPTSAPTATPTPEPTATPTSTPTPASTSAAALAPAVALAPAAIPATPQAISTITVSPFDVLIEPTLTQNVGVTAVHIRVAVVTIPRLPSTSTSGEYEQLDPLNFVQGFVLGVTLVLIGGLLMLRSRRST